jgi:hypothetical protein
MPSCLSGFQPRIESPAGNDALAFSVDEPTLRDGRLGVTHLPPPL